MLSCKEVPQWLKPTVLAGYTAGLKGLLHPVVGQSKGAFIPLSKFSLAFGPLYIRMFSLI